MTTVLKTKYGNTPRDQFIRNINEYSIFFSYNAPIVAKKDDKILLDSSKWNFSNTTGFYRNQFLDESIVETKKKIKSGLYVLTDLYRMLNMEKVDPRDSLHQILEANDIVAFYHDGCMHHAKIIRLTPKGATMQYGKSTVNKPYRKLIKITEQVIHAKETFPEYFI